MTLIFTWEMIKTAQTGRPDLIVFPSLRGPDGNSCQVRKSIQGSVWKCHFLCITSKSSLKCILSPAIHPERVRQKTECSPPQQRQIYITGKTFDFVILFVTLCCVFNGDNYIVWLAAHCFYNHVYYFASSDRKETAKCFFFFPANLNPYSNDVH